MLMTWISDRSVINTGRREYITMILSRHWAVVFTVVTVFVLVFMLQTKLLMKSPEPLLLNEAPRQELIVEPGIIQQIEQILIPETGVTVETRAALAARKKIISLGNSFWGEVAWEIGTGSGIFDQLECPVRNCHVTDEARDMPYGDAVLFHSHELGADPPVFKRPSHQRWIFFMLESPAYVPNKAYQSPQWRSQFNWTMTYRLDSDIPIPYGEVTKRKTYTPPKDYVTIAKSKSKMVAWIVSNCETGSQRERYVEVLRKYIPVDVYGGCGDKVCKKTMADADAGCGAMINETYLFYLAFENNFCKDYITEKFFKILKQDVVPIVRGGYDKNDYLKNVPENWFINSEDFESPNHLAKHLRYLRDNPDQYAKYFTGKEKYDNVAYYGLSKIPFWCDLCEKLNDPKEPPKIISDMSAWWGLSNCRPPNDLDGKLFNRNLLRRRTFQ